MNVDNINRLNTDELNSVLTDPIKIGENGRLPVILDNYRDIVH